MKAKASDWMIPAGLVLLSVVPAIGGTTRLAEVMGDAEVTMKNARFIASPVPIVLHVVAAVIYSFLGAFQFSPGIRRRHRSFHRVAGRILLPFAVLVAVSGLWMTVTYPWPAGDGVVVYLERLVVGVAMLLQVIMGVDALRRRKFSEHGDWMIRAYALGMGAGTQVLTHLPWFILMDGWPGETGRAVMMGSAWAINAFVAEWIIRRPVAHPKRVLVAA